MPHDEVREVAPSVAVHALMPLMRVRGDGAGTKPCSCAGRSEDEGFAPVFRRSAP